MSEVIEKIEKTFKKIEVAMGILIGLAVVCLVTAYALAGENPLEAVGIMALSAGGTYVVLTGVMKISDFYVERIYRKKRDRAGNVRAQEGE